jgi:exosortase H (IPTLxxWG-CTERM-specific)
MAGSRPKSDPKPKSAKSGQRPLNPNALVWRFALTFIGLALVFSALVRLDESLLNRELGTWLTHHVAAVVISAMQLLGAGVSGSGDTVFYGSSVFEILPDCTGIEFVGLFTAAVLAFPSSWKDRLVALLVGIPVLAVLNLARMVSLIYIGSHSSQALKYGHLYVWPVVLLAVSLGIWLGWARRAARDPRLLA